MTLLDRLSAARADRYRVIAVMNVAVNARDAMQSAPETVAVTLADADVTAAAQATAGLT